MLKKAVFTIMALGLVALALVIADFAVRIAMPTLDPSGQIRFETDKETGLVLGPRDTSLRQTKNTGEFDVDISFNSRGFRDDKDVASAVPKSLIVAGDSLCFGWGVDKSVRFTERLQEALGEPVYNIGIPTGLDSSYDLVRYARDLGARSDTVVLLVSAEARIMNYDVLNPKETSRRGGNKVLKAIKEFLIEHSAIYRLVTGAVHRVPVLRDAFVSLGLIVPAMEGVPSRIYDPAAIASTARIIDRFKGLTQRLLVVFAPSRAMWLEKEREAERKTYDELIAAVRAKGIETVDLRPYLEADGSPFDHFFKTDGHWNPSGHRIAADAIALYLKGQ